MSSKVPQSIPGFRTGSRIIMHLLSNYTVHGRHNIPEEGAFLMCTNHMSYWDAPAMGGALTLSLPGFAAKKYKGTVFGILFNVGAPVWIEQDAPDRKALQRALEIIKQGNPFAVAPEGTRSHTGALIEGKEGAAFLATRTNIPILPAVMWGTENIGKRLRPKVNIVFGKTFKLPEGRAKGDELKEYTDRIMCALAALMPEKYHGFYAGHPLIEEMAEIVRE